MHRKSVEKYLGTPLLPCHYLVWWGWAVGVAVVNPLPAPVSIQTTPRARTGTPSTAKIVVIVPAHAWWHWRQVLLDLVARSRADSWCDIGNMGEWESRLWLCILHRRWVQHFEQTRHEAETLSQSSAVRKIHDILNFRTIFIHIRYLLSKQINSLFLFDPNFEMFPVKLWCNNSLHCSEDIV